MVTSKGGQSSRSMTRARLISRLQCGANASLRHAPRHGPRQQAGSRENWSDESGEAARPRNHQEALDAIICCAERRNSMTHREAIEEIIDDIPIGFSLTLRAYNRRHARRRAPAIAVSTGAECRWRPVLKSCRRQRLKRNAPANARQLVSCATAGRRAKSCRGNRRAQGRLPRGDATLVDLRVACDTARASCRPS